MNLNPAFAGGGVVSFKKSLKRQEIFDRLESPEKQALNSKCLKQVHLAKRRHQVPSIFILDLKLTFFKIYTFFME